MERWTRYNDTHNETHTSFGGIDDADQAACSRRSTASTLRTTSGGAYASQSDGKDTCCLSGPECLPGRTAVTPSRRECDDLGSAGLLLASASPFGHCQKKKFVLESIFILLWVIRLPWESLWVHLITHHVCSIWEIPQWLDFSPVPLQQCTLRQFIVGCPGRSLTFLCDRLESYYSEGESSIHRCARFSVFEFFRVCRLLSASDSRCASSYRVSWLLICPLCPSARVSPLSCIGRFSMSKRVTFPRRFLHSLGDHDSRVSVSLATVGLLPSRRTGELLSLSPPPPLCFFRVGESFISSLGLSAPDSVAHNLLVAFHIVPERLCSSSRSSFPPSHSSDSECLSSVPSSWTDSSIHPMPLSPTRLFSLCLCALRSWKPSSPFFSLFLRIVRFSCLHDLFFLCLWMALRTRILTFDWSPQVFFVFCGHIQSRGDSLPSGGRCLSVHSLYRIRVGDSSSCHSICKFFFSTSFLECRLFRWRSRAFGETITLSSLCSCSRSIL